MGAQEDTILSMVTGSGPVVQAVLIILIILSLWSWAITIAKLLHFSRARKDSSEFTSVFWESRNLSRIDDSTKRLGSSPLAQVFSSGYKELSHLLHERDQKDGSDEEFPAMASGRGELGVLEMALKRAEFEQAIKLEKGVTFLATVASAAPFIGLFGTVWGIMNAFHSLGSGAQATTIQAVAPGISEALVATAIGLAAAIPAAIAYNFFAVGIRHFKQSMSRFSEEFLNIAERYFV